MSDAKHLKKLVRNARLAYNDDREKRCDLSSSFFSSHALWAIYRAIDAAFPEPETPDQMVGGTRNLHNPPKYDGQINCQKCGTRHPLWEPCQGDAGKGEPDANKKAELEDDSRYVQAKNPRSGKWIIIDRDKGEIAQLTSSSGPVPGIPIAKREAETEPDADTAQADLNRQRCVNPEWRVNDLEQRVSKLEAGGKSPFPKCPSCGRSVVAKVNTCHEVRTYKCENKSCITDTIRIERNQEGE